MAVKGNRQEPQKIDMMEGLDSVSVPCFSSLKQIQKGENDQQIESQQENAKAPWMLNLTCKEEEGMKVRDGFEDFLLPIATDIFIGSAIDERTGDLFYISKTSTGSFKLGRMYRGTSTRIESQPFTLIPQAVSKIKFKVFTRFPITTNSVYFYGIGDTGDRFSLKTTATPNFSPVQQSDLASTGFANPLTLIDHSFINDKIFCLIRNTGTDDFRVAYNNSINLNDYYNLPNTVMPTAIFSAGSSVYVAGERKILRIVFEDNFQSNKVLETYVDSYGITNPYVYKKIGAMIFAHCPSAFFALSLTDKVVLNNADFVQTIDSSISNLYPSFRPEHSCYKFDEKNLYFFGSFDNKISYKAIFNFVIRNSSSQYPTWEDFYNANKDKWIFALAFNLEKGSWFLMYYNEEIMQLQYFPINNFKGLPCEFAYTVNQAVCLANKEFSKDRTVNFPIGLSPKIINPQILSGGSISLKAVWLSFSTRDTIPEKINIVSMPSNLRKNIVRTSPDNLNDDAVFLNEGTQKGIGTYKFNCNISGVAISCFILAASDFMETIMGCLATTVITGRETI